jgi:hypothetical protein
MLETTCLGMNARGWKLERTIDGEENSMLVDCCRPDGVVTAEGVSTDKNQYAPTWGIAGELTMYRIMLGNLSSVVEC